MEFLHKPVMLKEMIQNLKPKDGKRYLDCTFGAGGYSKAILDSANCYVVALDLDPNVLVYAGELEKSYPKRFNFIKTNFADCFDKLGNLEFDGVILDLGVSSMQLDTPERGFSFLHDGPLSMRMSDDGLSAEEFINSALEEEIADVIYKYGDEGFSRRIARKIVQYRKIAKIDSTSKLAEIVRSSIGFRKGKIDPATKTFQAIRIYINNELGELEKFLAQVREILQVNGRLIVISFHSLEDRIVKNFFKENSKKSIAKSKYAQEMVGDLDPDKWLKIITNKVLKPTRDEILQNPRSRSARLRGAVKVI